MFRQMCSARISENGAIDVLFAFSLARRIKRRSLETPGVELQCVLQCKINEVELLQSGFSRNRRQFFSLIPLNLTQKRRNIVSTKPTLRACTIVSMILRPFVVCGLLAIIFTM